MLDATVALSLVILLDLFNRSGATPGQNNEKRGVGLLSISVPPGFLHLWS